MSSTIWKGCIIFLLYSCSSVNNDGSIIAMRHSKHHINIQQMKFNPAEIIVNKGDTVIWTNRDILDHNVTEESNRLWFSPTITNGSSWSMIVSGSTDYYCSLHMVMKGKVIVDGQ